MCGIAGFLNKNSSYDFATLNKLANDMALTLRHRGPDDYGTWCDETQQIALAHTRLTILDLSPRAKQPMTSANQSFVITYNGEIYNYLALKQDLEKCGYPFQTTSDTEVLLALIQQYGLEQALTKINGMFAFALWDKQNKTLHLARDRVGKKPLFWYYDGTQFAFASELKALQVLENLNLAISTEAVQLFLQLSYIPTPLSIFKNTHKLIPGSFLTASLKKAPVIKQYWHVNDCLYKPIDNIPLAQLKIHLKQKLTTAVKQRLCSDVPLGAFLSGGIDSSLITAIMCDVGNVAPKTFCIGFSEQEFNEAKYAKQIANYLGTEHTEYYASTKEAQAIIPNLANMYDEPFADSSQIPTALVAKIAKQQVTVALTGDGGDEVFAGYNRYIVTKKIWKYLKYTPLPIRTYISKILKKIPLSMWDRVLNLVPKIKNIPQKGDKIDKLARLISQDNLLACYFQLINHVQDPGKLFNSYTTDLKYYFPQNLETESATNNLQLIDIQSYLRDDILCKVDRATMHVGLEARSPLLDTNIIEWAMRLPPNARIHNSSGKCILKSLLADYIPEKLFMRPKQGFGVPLASWLRSDLNNWASDTLNNSMLKEYINEKHLKYIWQQFNSKKGNYTYLLWNTMMLSSWHENWKKQNSISKFEQQTRVGKLL